MTTLKLFLSEHGALCADLLQESRGKRIRGAGYGGAGAARCAVILSELIDDEESVIIR